MNVRNRGVVLWLVLVAIAILTPQNAVACTCMPFPNDEAKAAAMAFAMADVIFVGVVTDVKTKRLRPLAVRDTTFEVLQAWKGPVGGDLTVVRSAVGEIACGYEFDKPGEYLVFAYWDVEHQILTTSMCDLNRESSRAVGLITELDKIKAGMD